ncbi:MAG: hypothetical protein ABIF18_03115 [archaeon]
MFSNVYEIAQNYNLSKTIICSIPNMTKLYESLEAKTHYSGHFTFGKDSLKYHPLDLLMINPTNDSVQSLSALVKKNSQIKNIPIKYGYHPEREARVCNASI